MKKYVPVESEVSAIRFTLDREVIAEIIDFALSGRFSPEDRLKRIDLYYDEECICFPGGSCAYLGSYIVKHQNGAVSVMREHRFFELYKDTE